MCPAQNDSRRSLWQDSLGLHYLIQLFWESARQEKIDLIIMGTKGRKGLEYTIFGSVCQKVVREASCPVVTINPAMG
jgi:hypothetical protein